MPLIWILYLFTELYLIIEIGSYVGALGMFVEMILSALIGGMILVNFSNLSAELLQRVARREIKSEEFIALSLFKVLGAILLIMPGVLTDILGILLQMELIAGRFALLFAKKSTAKKSEHKSQDVIDVEVIG